MVEQMMGTVLAWLVYWFKAVPILCCPLFWAIAGQAEQGVVARVVDGEVGVGAGEDHGSELLLLFQLAEGLPHLGLALLPLLPMAWCAHVCWAATHTVWHWYPLLHLCHQQYQLLVLHHLVVLELWGVPGDDVGNLCNECLGGLLPHAKSGCACRTARCVDNTEQTAIPHRDCHNKLASAMAGLYLDPVAYLA